MRNADNKQHRCGVCWKWANAHEEWIEHITDEHGSVLRGFGYDKCNSDCPGERHARRLSNFGELHRKAKPVDLTPIHAKDGYTYTPQPLPLDQAS